MRTACVLVGLVVVYHVAAGAQGAPARAAPNAAYLEVLGNGGLFSLNYERKLGSSASIRIGASNWSVTELRENGGETTVSAFPVLVNWLRGSRHHHLELGAGAVVGHKRETTSDPFGAPTGTQSGRFVSLTGTVGYRRERPLEPGRRFGHLFRAGLTPFFGFGNEDAAYPDRGFLPSVGVSYGLVF